MSRSEGRDLKSDRPSRRPALFESSLDLGRARASSVGFLLRRWSETTSAARGSFLRFRGAVHHEWATPVLDSICNERGLRALLRGSRNLTTVSGSHRRIRPKTRSFRHPRFARTPALPPMTFRRGSDPSLRPPFGHRVQAKSRPFTKPSVSTREAMHREAHDLPTRRWVERLLSFESATPWASAFRKPAVSCSATFRECYYRAPRLIARKKRRLKAIYLSTARRRDRPAYPQHTVNHGTLSTARTSAPIDAARRECRQTSTIPFVFDHCFSTVFPSAVRPRFLTGTR